MKLLNSPWPWAALALMNTITFLVYAIDKHIAKSRKGGRRVPERTLIALSFCGGCIGALFGMFLLWHKTKHVRFRILVPFSTLIWAAGITAWILFALHII